MTAVGTTRLGENGQSKTGARATFVRTLDDLARLGARELRELYAAGSVPDSIAALDGDLVGRMLAVVRLDRGAPLRVIAAGARARLFPWAGKSFHADNETTGMGINRVKLAGTRRLFPFATRVGPSVLDDEPAIILDYDQPENPMPIRMIHDEVREVAPKIFLGPAAVKRSKGRPVVVLWFALHAE